MKKAAGWKVVFAIGILVGAGFTGSLSGAANDADSDAGISSASPGTGEQLIEPNLLSVEVREGAPGVVLELVADSPLIWSTFRDSSDRLVVELANTTYGPELGDLAPDSGLVETVVMSHSDYGERSMTRIVVTTRGEAEHALDADGARLSIAFQPTGANALLNPPVLAEPGEAAMVTTEEISAEPMAVEASALPTMAQPTVEVGTADNPYQGEEPEGVRASQLTAVVSETFGETALVQIMGDGSFEFAAFQLEDPARFVLDLPGVVKTTDQSQLNINHDLVSGVRVGQYRAEPDPVSRVVFDLTAPAVPQIEPLPEGIAVSFSALSVASSFPQPEQGLPAIAQTSQPVLEEALIEQPVAMEEVEPVIAELAEPALPKVEIESDAEAVEVTAEEVTAETENLDLEPLETETEEVEQIAAVSEDVQIDVPFEAVEPIAMVAASEMEPIAEIMTEPQAPETTWEADPPIEEQVVVEVADESAIETDEETMVVEEAAEAVVETEYDPLPAIDTEVEDFDLMAAEPILEEEEVVSLQAEPMLEPMSNAGSDAAAASFQAQDIGEGRKYQGEPIDLSLQDADVKDVLRSFAQLSGLNVVVQPGVTGRVTVELVQVPWDQALEQILKINDLGYDLDGNIMRIAPIGKLRQEAEEQQRLRSARALSVPLSTVIRRISYARAREIAGVLTARGGVMSNRGSIIVDNRTNTLIIKELPSFMNTVIAIIENLDIPEPQVMIEARIIETTKRFSRSLGIQWGFQGVSSAATGNTTGLEFPNNGTIDGGVNLLTGAATSAWVTSSIHSIWTRLSTRRKVRA
jgi:type IV pilus assembly protein PilQ